MVRRLGSVTRIPYLARMPGTTLPDRALLRLSGEEVRGFLQGLVTNDLDLLAPERPLWAGLLTAQGKALFDFILWADGEDVLIDCEAEQAEALARRLTLYRLRRAITIAPEPALAVHWAPDGDGRHRLTRALPRSAAAGSHPPATRQLAGWSIASASASPKASPNWAATRHSGSNAMPPS